MEKNTFFFKLKNTADSYWNHTDNHEIKFFRWDVNGITSAK